MEATHDRLTRARGRAWAPPGYRAPEQAAGKNEQIGETDVYGLGFLYAMLHRGPADPGRSYSSSCSAR
ncbi:MAG: hypothetical protein R3F62_15075 [Planctomycetota bacterium]